MKLGAGLPDPGLCLLHTQAHTHTHTPTSLLPSNCAAPKAVCAGSSLHCPSSRFGPGGDGCPPPSLLHPPFVPPRSSPAYDPPRLHFQQAFNYLLSACFICLCGSATRGGIPTAHSSAGRFHGLDTSLRRYGLISPNQNISF